MSYNILIVDDSKSMRKVISKVLQASGFQVGTLMEAENGQEALGVLEKEWVDIILSDIHMPIMNGVEFLRVLKDQEELKELPIVFITTESNEERVNEIMSLGANGYIRKPFRPEDIRSLLSKIMGEGNGEGMAADDEKCDF